MDARGLSLSVLFVVKLIWVVCLRLGNKKVNATVVSDSGATCVCHDPVDPSCADNVEYSLCVNVVRRDLITATAAVAALGSFCMGLFANMPIALAPGSAYIPSPRHIFSPRCTEFSDVLGQWA